MKLLFKNKRYILSIFLTALMVFCTHTSGYADITPVQDRTPQIRDAIIAAVPGVNSADDVTAAHLAAITTLEASKKSISALKAGDFSGLTALTTLDLSRNSISDISVLGSLAKLTTLELSHNAITDISVLEKLTKLRWLFLSHNTISDISALTNLTALKHLWLGGNSISDISALAKLTKLKKLWLSRNTISDISVLAKLTPLTALWLDGNSISNVSALEGLISLISLNLSGNPISDLGPLRRLKAANPDITIDIDIDENNNNAPVFTAGTSTTRSVAENTASGTNIGSPIAATDADTGDTLTYTLGGTDAASFSIVSTSGQLHTNAALDYETKTSYSVSVSVSDGNGGSDSIAVTINVTDVNENRAPAFTAGTSTTRSIAENSNSGTDIGSAVSATDADNDTLTYTLGGTDAASFSIVGTSGQLQTNTALNYESKSSYSVSVSVSDNNGGSDSIAVTINVTNVNEAPSFATNTATRSIAENTAANTNIGAALTATDVDANTTFAYTLGGTDASSFGIVSTTGQLQTSAALDRETKASYSVTVTASDGSLSDTIAVTINVTNVNEAPTFATTTATRAIAENTATNQNIGAVFTATDVDSGTTLTYSIPTTGDAAAFSIVSNTGQLKTKNALNYEDKNSYTVVVTASDGSLTDTITVTISVTNVNEAPAFATGTTISNISVTNGTAITSVTLPEASDPDANTTLTYTVTPALPAGLTFTASTRVLSGTPTAVSASTTYTYTVSDSTLSDTLTFKIQVNAPANRAPTFTAGTSTTRSIAENTASGENIGSAVAATDADNNTLAYTLGGTDAASFSIVSTSGQLQTNAALNYESKSSYSVSVSVSDNNGGSDSIDVTISVTDVNEAPSFASSTATRSIAENTVSGEDIGAAVVATDVDGDTLTYTLGGTDASSFSIVSTSGQLQTSAALDYETKNSYSVTVTAADGTGDSSLSTSIPVTINLTDANDAPVFTDGDSTTRTIAENSVANTNIGTTVTATDQDKKPDPVNIGQLIAKDTITYSIPTAGDAAAFSIDSNTGQLKTKNALNYENDNSYTVVVTASDGTLTDTITVTISVTNVNEAPAFATGATISDISATNGTAITSVTLPAATDPDANTTLTYTVTPTLPAGLTFTASTRILAGTPTAVSASTTYTYTASDSTLSATLTFTIQVSAPANNPPTFTDGSSTTRSVAENTASGQNIGSAVAATDTDNDTLTYTLGGTDASSFSIVSNTGQLQTSAALDRETKASYSVTITADDGNTANNTDSIAVTISVTNVNEKPSFDISGRVTLSVAENTAANTNIGDAFQATDPDSGDTVTYSLQRGDKDSFSINANTGQLKTRAALDYETKNAYSNLAVRATDSEGLVNSVLVTVNVTNANEAPAFSAGTTISSISATNGTAITSVTLPAATDPDANTTLTYTVTPALPAGLTFTPSTRVLSGTPTAVSALTTYTYTASDSNLSATLTFTIQVSAGNSAPTFTDGASTTRSVAEWAAADVNIGTAVAATDTDTNDTLTYTLGGTDASSFSIVSTSGQLQTSAALDYETKSSYAVSVSVSDGRGGSDSIAVTINVTDANDSPVFTDGDRTTRSVAENTAADTNIGTPVAATDQDGDTLQYTYGFAPDFSNNPDHAAFTIDSTSGQIKTKAALDFETRSSYLLYLMVSDDVFLTQITVTISVTDVNEAPSFASTTATRSIDQTATSGTNIGAAVAATDPDINTLTYTPKDTLTYTLSGTDASSFTIVSTSGQLQTKAALDYETKSSYAVTVSVSDGNGKSDTISVTINVTTTPVFTEGTSTTRSVAEYTSADTNIGSPIAATDEDNDTLTYSLVGSPDAYSFSIVSTSGQLRTSAALNYDTQSSYSVTVSVDDGNGGSDSIAVTINVTDVVNEPPMFTDGTSTIRSIAENTASGTNIGTAIGATDTDTGDTLTYTLGGTDAASFSIVGTSGQIRTSAALNYESKSSYSVSVSVSDGNGGSDSIAVTISVTDVNEAPSFATTTATRSIWENADFGEELGAAVAATDPDTGDTLTYTLGGTDAASFRIVSTSGMLQTNALLDYETKNVYSVSVSVSDGNGGSANISVTINITDANERAGNNAPTFTEGASTTRSIAEGRDSPRSIGAVLAATDADNDRLSYSLGGTDAASFFINPVLGNLLTRTALDYETKNSYSVTAIVQDGHGGNDSIAVTINVTDVVAEVAPLPDRTPAVRSAIAKALGITNPANIREENLARVTELSIVNKSISLQPGDLSGLTNLTWLNLSSNNISDISELSGLTKLTYLNLNGNNIGGASFGGNNNAAAAPPAPSVLRGQLNQNNEDLTDLSPLSGMTNLKVLYLSNNKISDISALSGLTNLEELYLWKNSISDISPLSSLTKLKYLDIFTNSISDISHLRGLTKLWYLDLSDNDISDLTPLSSGFAGLSYLYLSENNISDLSSLSSLTKLADLYLHDNPISDLSTLSSMTDLQALSVGGTSVTDISALSSLTSLRSFYLYGTSVTDISALSSMTKLIVLTLTDNKSLSDLSPLTTLLPKLLQISLTHNNISDVSALSGLSEKVEIFELRGNPIPFSAYATLRTFTFSPEDMDLNNRPPVFTAGATATRTVAENTAAGTNIGAVLAATDTEGDTIYYSLGGTDAASFSIDSTTGQLQTKAALDFETKSSYTVTVDASGNAADNEYRDIFRDYAYREKGKGLDRITVTINVTNVAGEAPKFSTSGRVTLTVAENTATNTNIGDPFQAIPESGQTVTYSLQRGDAGSFSIDANTGQMKTSAALDYETKNSYTDLAVRATDGAGRVGSVLVTVNVTDVAGAAPSIETLVLPETTELLSNYPNPFNPETWIPYQLAEPAEVTLTIYDIRGRVVRTLRLGHQPAGFYRNRSKAAHWDGRNYLGEKVATGIYFYTLKAGDYMATRKLLIRK